MNKQIKVMKTIVTLFLATMLMTACNNREKEASSSKSSQITDSSKDSKLDILESDKNSDGINSNSVENETSNIGAAPNNNDNKSDDSNHKSVNPIKLNVVRPDGEEQYIEYNSLSDIDLNRPTCLKYNEVFSGWMESETISGIVEHSINTNESIQLTPIITDISESINTLYNDTVYVEISEKYITVPVKIGGDTNFAVLDLEIDYNSELLEFDSFSYNDVDAECNCPEKGKIIISFVSTSNIDSELDLCDVKFKLLNDKKEETRLEFNVLDIAAWNSDFTDYINVKHNIVDNKIVVY